MAADIRVLPSPEMAAAVIDATRSHQPGSRIHQVMTAITPRFSGALGRIRTCAHGSGGGSAFVGLSLVETHIRHAELNPSRALPVTPAGSIV